METHCRHIKEEKDIVVKHTLLNYSTIFPTNFEKQKVQLTFNVFNEKTVAVLKLNGADSTEAFVRLVTRMMNMLNVRRSPHTATKLNNPDRETFRRVDDYRFEFLEHMAGMCGKMDSSSSKYPGRVMCLTNQTSNALSVTIRGVVEVAKHCCKKELLML